MSASSLAIVIPYFKNDFFEHVLESLSSQTCLDFTVYIGDDHSPNAIEPILSRYKDKLNIVYHRFDKNLGSISLTKQWERCVNLSTENWIWLFSDDDVIEQNAVEVFYNSIDENNFLYKFNTQIIDERGILNPMFKKHDSFNKLEGYISSDYLINNRLQAQGFRSFAVEYVFHRSLFLKHGFINFPLAWNSDDATWLRYSIANGKAIKLLNSTVYWRLSTSNITSNTISPFVIQQKVEASILYIDWLSQLVFLEKLHIEPILILKWFSIQIGSFMPEISISDFRKMLRDRPYTFHYFAVSFNFLRYVKCRIATRYFRDILRKISN